MNKYFSFYELDIPALKFHDTEQEARARAEKAMDDERIAAAEGWNPEIIDNPICWGEVKQCMVQVSCKKMPKGHEWDEEVDYDLKPV